ncbi:hypothetical protein LRAMOSA09252 [Lichtheimia ramosa]|uniref:Vacuolar segregation protein 7 n=1 Tax=Lichtheimia ramosa TaxID=688394 RepID=A0A077WH69_9FUNG|nr:hypothetical protein LRAMOSA09252 [Lichtheimia ramosa]
MDKSDSSQTTASSATSTLPTTFATDDEQQQLKKDAERRPSPPTGSRLGGRPKLTTIHSSDASRFMTLERLQQNMTLKPPTKTTTSSVTGNSGGDGSNNNNGSGVHNNSNNNSTTQERQLTIETAVFPEQQPIFHHEKKRSQASDTLKSGSDSTLHRSPRRTKKRNKPFTKPAEIFAQNLSDAVLHANIDSDEEESFVYRDYRSTSLYPTLPTQWIDHHYSKRDTTDYSSTATETKPRRPVLRSAVSELPATAMLRSTFPAPSRKHSWYTAAASDADDTPLLPRYATSKRKRRSSSRASKSAITLWAIFGVTTFLISLWILIICMASPLAAVQVMELSNVLGSTKELFFDLHVRARNSNPWSIQISHASFSVFASSHYVPISSQVAINNTSSNQAPTAAPVEFLGTIYRFDEPLVFAPSKLTSPTVTTATSQIQIKDPGKTKGDSSGNERWALLIRYPYELTVRGVLKYRVIPFLPFTQMHSARVCQVSRIDPATGDIHSSPEIERSICDDPSPIDIIY